MQMHLSPQLVLFHIGPGLMVGISSLAMNIPCFPQVENYINYIGGCIWLLSILDHWRAQLICFMSQGMMNRYLDVA